MSNKDLIYKNRAIVKYTSLVLFLVGLVLAYFYYGTEPHETIGGFLCGLGLGLFLIYIAINNKS
jgi:hypothetical protein